METNNSDEHCTFTQLCDAVEDEAASALTAVGSHKVHTAVITAHVACTTFIYVYRQRQARK